VASCFSWLERSSRACRASLGITLTSSTPVRSRRWRCHVRAANGRSARRALRRVARPARWLRPDDDGVGGGSPVAGEPTVRRRGWSRADRVLIADAAQQRQRAGLGAIPITRLTGSRRSERPSAADAVAEDARAGGPCRPAATSDARDTRRQANRRRRPQCRAGHEYADGDRQTPMMTSRPTGAAANPSRRGPRQPGRRRRFSPRGGGRAGRHGPPARASW
jgi:hypothetical protein